MISKNRIFPANCISCALFVSLTTIFLMVNNIGVIAQSADNANASHSEAKDTTIYTVVEQMPEFPGGFGACMNFLARNMRYPKDAFIKGEEGRVIVQFVINRNGKVSDIEIVQSVSPSLDAEARRVIKSMPKWKPGTQNGKPVRVRFTLPLVFKLNNEKDSTITIVDSILTKPEETAKANKDKVHLFIDKKPEFPGGMNVFMKWIAKNMKYPAEAQKEKQQGRVIVSFMVEKDGSITNAKIEQSVSPTLDAEALRLVKAMPAWTPAEAKGEAVRSYYSLPFMFNLR